MAVVFGKWSNARASLEKLRDKAHGEGKGPKTVAYTPKEPKMIILVRLFLYDVPFYHYPHLIACYG